MIERVMRGCPFCGGEARLYSVSLPMTADCADVQVACNKCDTIGPSVLFDQTEHTEGDIPALEAEAITAWNTRIEATPAVDREAVAQICYTPDKVALIPWSEALLFAGSHPRSATARCVNRAFELADRILALPPVKQSDGLAERVREACAVACREALFPKNERSDWTDFAVICAGNAVTAERAIRSLDITRMDSDG